MGKKQKNEVILTAEEREHLIKNTKESNWSPNEVMRAQILLRADRNNGAMEDLKIAEELHCGRYMVTQLRKRFAKKRLGVIHDKPRVGRPNMIDGVEADIIAETCSDSPEGRERWTLLITEKVVTLTEVESCSHDSERKVIKKTSFNYFARKNWKIPSKASDDFVCRMEEVLELYKREYDPEHPLLCFESKQLRQAVIKTIPMEPKNPEFDMDYKRNEARSLFMILEPFEGKRHVHITEQRTKKEWADCMKIIVDELYPKAKKTTIIMENLKGQTPASLYENFAPEEARRIIEKLDIQYTPQQGGWLNMAEIEFSDLFRKCLNRRIDTMEGLMHEVKAWEKERNMAAIKYNWRFGRDDARIRLKKLYPKI